MLSMTLSLIRTTRIKIKYHSNGFINFELRLHIIQSMVLLWNGVTQTRKVLQRKISKNYYYNAGEKASAKAKEKGKNKQTNNREGITDQNMKKLNVF